MLFKALRALFLTCVILLLASFCLVQTAFARQKIAHLIEEKLQEHTSYQAQVDAVKISFPLRFQAEKVRLSKAGNSYLVIEGLTADLSFFSLFKGKFVLSSLKVGTIELHELAQCEEKTTESKDKNILPFSLSLPFEIAHFEIDKIFAPKLLAPLKEQLGLEISALHVEGFFSSSLFRLSFNQKSLEGSLTSTKHHTEVECHLKNCPLIKEVHLTASLNTSLLQPVIEEAEGPFHLTYKLDPAHAPFHEGKVKGAIAINKSGQLTFQQLIAHSGPLTLAGSGKITEESTLQNTRFILTSSQLPLLVTFYAFNKHWTSEGDPIKEKLIETLSALEQKKIFDGLDKSEPLLNDLIAECSFTGSLFSPQIDLSLTASSLAIGNYSFRNVRASWNLSEALVNAFNINFDAHTRSVKGEGTVLISDDQQLLLKGLSLWSEEDHLTAELSFDLDQYYLDGKLDVSIQELKAYLPEKVSGGLTFHTSFTSDPSFKQQQFLFTFNSPSILIASHQWENILAEGEIYTINQQPSGHIKLTTGKGVFLDTPFDNLAFETTIDPASPSWPYAVKAIGNLGKELSLDIEGAWHCNTESFRFAMTSLETVLTSGHLSLREPFYLAFQQNTIEVSPLFLSINDGTLYSSFEYTDNFLHIATRVADIPANLISHFFTIPPLEGSLSGEFFLFGSPIHPEGHIQVTIDQLKIDHRDFTKLPTLYATFGAHIDGQLINCQGEIVGLGKKPIAFSTHLPISYSLFPPRFRFNKEQPLFAQLELSSEITPLLETFVTDLNRISGEMNVAIDIRGSLAKPIINGTIELENGGFESLETGAIYSNVSAQILGYEKTLVLKELNATSQNGGTIIGTGEMQLIAKEHFPFDLNFQLQNTTLVQLDSTSATASGTLNLKGNLQEAMLEGTLTTQAIHTTLPTTNTPIPEDFTVTYINQSEKGAVPSKMTNPQAKWPIHLNLDIQIPGNAHLTATNLTSEWNGELHFEGTTQAPLIFGKINLNKGEYIYNGKAFTSTEGNIQFGGDLTKKTTLLVIASRTIGDITFDAILKGPIYNPLLSFRSSPLLSQKEILSWLLFNRGLGEINPLENAHLTQSAEILNQDFGNSSTNVLSELQSRLGIDQLDFTHSQDSDKNDVSVQVGKYLTPKLFISLSKSMTQEPDRVSIEANLIPNVRVEANVNDDADGQFFLKWKKDY